MRAYDIILKKRNGFSLNRKEINFFINGYIKNEIPDYQMAALLMAIYFNGLSKKETSDLTMCFVNSGELVDLSKIEGIKVDKHSTGGVGDKVTLIVIPLIASLGITVAKVSGRGLGHTGGTIDKLESIEGFKTQLSKNEFIQNVNNHKMAITGQTADITPADKMIYALRDVTATVESIPLIASSIMSKKIASGADCIVLDVKVGSGAFIKSVDKAMELSQMMVDIGKELNKKTIAVITDMNQPLGYEIGNANEIKEAVKVLSGKGPDDIRIISLTIASYMAVLAGKYFDFKAAYYELEKILSSGKALKKLKELVEIQCGNIDFIDNLSLLPQAKSHIEIKSSYEGYICSIDTEKIGHVAMKLGAGRKRVEDLIDLSAGITLNKKIGDHIKKDENLCVLHTNIIEYAELEILAKESFVIGKKSVKKNQYVYDVIQ